MLDQDVADLFAAGWKFPKGCMSVLSTTKFSSWGKSLVKMPREEGPSVRGVASGEAARAVVKKGIAALGDYSPASACSARRKRPRAEDCSDRHCWVVAEVH